MKAYVARHANGPVAAKICLDYAAIVVALAVQASFYVRGGDGLEFLWIMLSTLPLSIPTSALTNAILDSTGFPYADHLMWLRSIFALIMLALAGLLQAWLIWRLGRGRRLTG